MIAGIDYGSKYAGTTVIAYCGDSNQLEIVQSIKKKDADAMILSTCDECHFDCLYIDAPLSLPGVYTGMASFDDFFYRKGDKEISAMSPMFLGGLTARAMKLSKTLKSKSPTTNVIEVYPGGCAREWAVILEIYKKELMPSIAVLKEKLSSFNIYLDEKKVLNWHCFDAILAYYIGLKHQNGEAKPLGDPKEGLIWV